MGCCWGVILFLGGFIVRLMGGVVFWQRSCLVGAVWCFGGSRVWGGAVWCFGGNRVWGTFGEFLGRFSWGPQCKFGKPSVFQITGFALSKYKLAKLSASCRFVILYFGTAHCFRVHYIISCRLGEYFFIYLGFVYYFLFLFSLFSFSLFLFPLFLFSLLLFSLFLFPLFPFSLLLFSLFLFSLLLLFLLLFSLLLFSLLLFSLFFIL